MTPTATTRSRQRQEEAELRRLLAAQDRRRRQTRRIVVAAGGTVVAIVATFVLIGAVTSSSPGPATRPDAVPLSVLGDLTGVPDATLTAVGAGLSTNPPHAVTGALRVVDGKPQVLYLGAEYCPFCAAQRWPLIQALSRFGHFMGLRTTRSAADDVHPNTPTFTFHGVTYMSDYLSFTPRELYTNVRKGSGYTPLDTAPADEMALLRQYGGGFPLLDIGGRYVQVGTSFNPDLLHGLEWAQIAAALKDPQSDLARAIDGSANVLTARLCQVTSGQPTYVCNAPAVQAASGG